MKVKAYKLNRCRKYDPLLKMTLAAVKSSVRSSLGLAVKRFYKHILCGLSPVVQVSSYVLSLESIE